MLISLGNLAGLRLTAKPSAIIWAIVLWAAATEFAQAVVEVPLALALVEGLAVVAIHFAADLAHQFGHAAAARRTGYPMIGIRFWFLLSTSIYPRDEPELPAATHVRRALGGAPVNIVLGLLSGLVVYLMVAGQNHYAWLAIFSAADNIFILGFGAFLPLGFTDGSTLLKYRQTAR